MLPETFRRATHLWWPELHIRSRKFATLIG